MELLIDIYHSQHWFVQEIMKFIFVVIVLRGIIANEINAELRRLWKWARSDRPRIIWNHFSQNHREADILECNQPRCMSL